MSVTDVIPRLLSFLNTDIWRVRLDEVSGWRRRGISALRVLLIAVRKFVSDRCPLRASSLTFFSLLSVVPILAMGFAVAKGFGLQSRLERLIVEQLAGQEEVVTRLIGFSRNLLENTSGGIIAGVGAAFLLWTVISVLGTAEDSFNYIWGIRQPRPMSRKLTDYLAIMLISPILLIMSSSAIVLVTAQINQLMEAFGFLGLISPVIALIVQVIPYVLIWLLFSFVLIFLPNTRVSLSSGILAGVAAGTLFVFVQWAYINFQIGVARYNAIYGSFAALPLFLVWVQLSWYIVLFGVELSHAHQNQRRFEFAPDIERLSHSFRRLVSLRIMHLVIKNFAQGNPPLCGEQISERLKVPESLARQTLSELEQVSLLTAIPTSGYDQSIYQPARSINDLNVSFVLRTMEDSGQASIPLAEDEACGRLSASLAAFAEAVEKSPENRLLKDL